MMEFGIIAAAVVGYTIVGGGVAAVMIPSEGELDDEVIFIAIFWPLLVITAPAFLSYRLFSYLLGSES